MAYNKYTPEGREAMISKTNVNINILHALLNQKHVNRSMEYMDNRITVYTAQKGKCGVTGLELELDDMHCHHKTPIKLGGTDEFKNLIYLKTDVHKLIHATNESTIKTLLKKLNPDTKQLNKINMLRNKCNLAEITKDEFY